MAYFLRQMFMGRRMDELENKDYTPDDQPASDDLYAHAAGRTCENCDRVIEPGQPARRRGESGWVHDHCPEAAIR
jgi:hypothetical protein